LRAIYGCIESALRWYILFKSTLEHEGFKLNAYDRCIANKVINKKQCNLAWYVDDNKLSHVDSAVIDDILQIIKKHFGDIKVTQGRKHKFLGMDIVFRDDKKVEIRMKEQLEEAIEEFGEKITGTVLSLARADFFTVNERKI